MGANFPRLKNWTATEDVTAADLNDEFDNILDNLTAANVDDYSTNVAQMQSTADPGEVGSESLATSTAGELQRLRHLIGEITGEDEWYESPTSSLLGLANAIGTGLTDNRLVSGRVRPTSAQPLFLTAAGSARTVTLRGSATNFIYYVKGTEYTISADVALTNLTLAPSSNNTCLINDATAADQYWTKYQGEDGTEIPVDTMGTEISSLVGQFAAFKLDNGVTEEYFIAYVKSSTALSKVKRGYFFDDAEAPAPRIAYANNDVITLMKLTWLFAKTDGTLTATYNNPVWSADEPGSPAIGDYWFDIGENKWKVYGVGAYSDADAMLIGVCIQDTANTVAARSFEFFKAYSELNTLEVLAESNTEVKARFPGAQVSVWGATIKNDHNITRWDITADRESGVSEAASTYYYVYLTETGDKIISDKKPHDRREDLRGFYHPDQSWRCVGRFFNNASSNIEQVDSYYTAQESSLIIRDEIASDYVAANDLIKSLSGTSRTIMLPPAATCRGRELIFTHAGTNLTQVYTLDGFNSEEIGGDTTYPLYTNGETLKIVSDGVKWIVLSHFAETDWISAGTLVIGATTTAPTKGTVLLDTVRYKRNGVFTRVRYQFYQSVAGTAGTGTYLPELPAGITFASSVVTSAGTVGADDTNHMSIALPGAKGGFRSNSGPSAARDYMIVPYDSNKFYCRMQQFGGNSFYLWGTAFTFGEVIGFNIELEFPVTGWKP
jgi:hypothetical protein